MKRYLLVNLIALTTAIIICSHASANIINPDSLNYDNDDGSQLFSFSSPGLLSIEFHDLLGDLGSPSSFGFFFLDTPISPVEIFSPTDHGALQIAAIDFSAGVVFDADQNELESTFVANSGSIGFYYSYFFNNTITTLTTLPGANPGGIDFTASFPHLQNDNQYILGFGSLTNQDPALAYYYVGPAPVPEPATFFLLGTGLACLIPTFRRRSSQKCLTKA